MDADELLDAGAEALKRGDWRGARTAFEKAVALAPSAAAWEGLGAACWWLDDQKAVVEARETAFRLYREARDDRSAARLATAIAIDYADYRSDMAVCSGWLQRAETLLRDLPASPEHGWFNIYRGFVALMFENDLPVANAHHAAVLDLVKRLPSIDLEMMAVGLKGLISVREGQVAQGLRYMDEAMTAAVGGEMADLMAIGNMCCSLIYACEAVADYDRASQWCNRTREFCRRLGLDTFFSICRNYYATVLIWNGAWDDAEAELAAAMRELEASRPASAQESLARLGELRRRQGRIEEAEQLFRRAEPHRTALYGQAALALERGDAASAIDLLERVLRRIGEEDQAEHVFTLDLLIRAHLALDGLDDARARLGELLLLVGQVGTRPLIATACAAQGLLALAEGNLIAARTHLEDALDLFEAGEAGFESGCTRLILAGVLRDLGRRPVAVEQAMLAQDALRRLGAVLYADKATALLAEISAGVPSPPATALPGGITEREAEVLRLIANGCTNQEIAEALVLSIRTVERHISSIYEKLGLHGRAARASAAALAVSLEANT